MGERFDRDRQVWRLEFEFGRAGLKQFGVETALEAIESAGALWRSVTADWLTLRSPSDDVTRSRWPIDAAWRYIQQARLVSDAIGLERARTGATEGSLRKLMPPLNGYLAHLGTLMGCDGIEDTVALLPQELRRYEAVSPLSFAGRVAERRRMMGRTR